jgi:hypothetical protein
MESSFIPCVIWGDVGSRHVFSDRRRMSLNHLRNTGAKSGSAAALYKVLGMLSFPSASLDPFNASCALGASISASRFITGHPSRGRSL